MHGLEILFIWQFSFPLKEASRAITQGGLRRFWCMKQVQARWYLEISLHSALSQHPLPCDSLLSATKATFLSCGSNCICQVVRTDIIQQHCSDGQDSWLAERISHISRTQEKNPNPLEMYRSSSDTYLKLHSVCDPPGGSKSLQKVTKESKPIARRLTFILQRQILLLKFSGSQKGKENIEKHQFK